MKILHAGIFQDHVLGGDIIFEKGFLQNGCAVERFDFRTIAKQKGVDQMYSALLDSLDGKDILFVGKGEVFNQKVFSEVKKRGVKIALWYGDIRPKPEEWLISLLKHVDFFFMSSGGEKLREYYLAGSPKIAAYYFNPSDPDLATRFQNMQRCTANVVMTGTPYGFANRERVETVKYLRKRDDVCFYGGIEKIIYQNRNVFIDILKRFIRPSRWVRGDEYIRAIKSACIGIGVSAFQDISKYSSDRLAHYLTFGTFYLTWEFPEIEKLFEIGKEIVCFNNITSLDEKIRYYLSNPDKREEIAIAGQKRILDNYNAKNITAMFLDIIQNGRSDRFEWVEVYK
jgi:spore maturation protein CgeB